jgi:UDP-N-acetylmuramate--alanine ligase
MSNSDNLRNDPNLAGLFASCLAKIRSFYPVDPVRWISVDTQNQGLVLAREPAEWLFWPVSTAAAGLNSRQDSGGTPPGLHRIGECIGAGRPVGTIFESREATGRIWTPDPASPARTGADTHDDLILTRLLTLEGMEDGVNHGPGCDSRERYIYIHGTNQEADIGKPVSHGCVRMRNEDMIELFDLVAEGDPVVII